MTPAAVAAKIISSPRVTAGHLDDWEASSRARKTSMVVTPLNHQEGKLCSLATSVDGDDVTQADTKIFSHNLHMDTQCA